MSADNGFNPMRWDCKLHGCFNQKCRPKIEIFAECFPRRINFGDVDGIVEIDGNAMFLEWKSQERELRPGQRLLYERLTGHGFIAAMVVVGDPETMAVRATSVYAGGRRYPEFGYEPASLALIKARLTAWSQWAMRHPVMNAIVDSRP